LDHDDHNETVDPVVFRGRVAMVSGCAVTGKWDLAAVEPTAARRDFKYEV